LTRLSINDQTKAGSIPAFSIFRSNVTHLASILRHSGTPRWSRATQEHRLQQGWVLVFSYGFTYLRIYLQA
ncbi:MAG TPA: hypothetical protein PLQ80_10815, partial [Candidatus Syntrophosphaera sp.]|nr:hypothetical protein [Candidatus Syntrophosphaera sp.]